eukprot:scaffold190891_cov26-Tisochrysis_lutea.AAC.2
MDFQRQRAGFCCLMCRDRHLPAFTGNMPWFRLSMKTCHEHHLDSLTSALHHSLALHGLYQPGALGMKQT